MRDIIDNPGFKVALQKAGVENGSQEERVEDGQWADSLAFVRGALEILGGQKCGICSGFGHHTSFGCLTETTALHDGFVKDW